MIIENQVIVITGAASGLGAACVELLHATGAKVASWDLHPNPEADFSMVCDVRLAADVEIALHKTIEKLGVPRVCVNCAGVAPAKRLVGKEGPMPLADFERAIAINLTGTFNVMRVIAHAITTAENNGSAQENGVIINTASIAAYEGQIGQLAYSASKGGVSAMTLPAARELAQWKIRVNTIAPGLMATPMLSVMPETVQDNLAATIPFPKRLGKPQEFAALVKHIIENEFINGEVIRLDGALRMQAK